MRRREGVAFLGPAEGRSGGTFRDVLILGFLAPQSGQAIKFSLPFMPQNGAERGPGEPKGGWEEPREGARGEPTEGREEPRGRGELKRGKWSLGHPLPGVIG
jgi:hypothetical protein